MTQLDFTLQARIYPGYVPHRNRFNLLQHAVGNHAKLFRLLLWSRVFILGYVCVTRHKPGAIEVVLSSAFPAFCDVFGGQWRKVCKVFLCGRLMDKRYLPWLDNLVIDALRMSWWLLWNSDWWRPLQILELVDDTDLLARFTQLIHHWHLLALSSNGLSVRNFTWTNTSCFHQPWLLFP